MSTGDDESVRIATWNMKQVAPRKTLDERWDWLATQVRPTIAVLTEAKVPTNGPPPGWTVLHTPDGVGSRRRWGTVLAARGVEVRDVGAAAKGGNHVDELWPGTAPQRQLARRSATTNRLHPHQSRPDR